MEKRIINEERTIVNEERSRVGVSRRPTSVMGQSERKSTEKTVNILLVDVSISTADPIDALDPLPKIDGIKDATTTFIVNSSPMAYLGGISFGSYANIEFDLQQRGANPRGLIDIVQRLTPGGSTAMCSSLLRAGELCSRASFGQDATRIYLLSDGISMDGDPVPIADDLKVKYPNLQIWTIGFGSGKDIDSETLKRVASRSAKNEPFYYFCKDAKNLSGVLKKQSRNLFT